MHRPSTRWLILAGACLTALSIFVNFLLEQDRVHVTPTEFSIFVYTFPPMFMIGLLVTLAGSVAWAWRHASVSRLASSGVVIVVIALLALKLTPPINVHGGGWTLWLGFACLDALLIAVLFLVFAAVRFTSSRLALRRK